MVEEVTLEEDLATTLDILIELRRETDKFIEELCNRPEKKRVWDYWSV